MELQIQYIASTTKYFFVSKSNSHIYIVLFLADSTEGAVGGLPASFELVEDEPNEDGGEIQIGSIRLQVVHGDITQETTDAIVNGTNPEMDVTRGKWLNILSFFHCLLGRHFLFVGLHFTFRN